jgi:hypothetical protein
MLADQRYAGWQVAISFGGTLAVMIPTKHSVTLIVSDYNIKSNTSQAPKIGSF